MFHAYPYWRIHSPVVVFASSVATAICFIVLIMTWILIAGQAGNPRPDNWDTMERILDIIEPGILISFSSD